MVRDHHCFSGKYYSYIDVENDIHLSYEATLGYHLGDYDTHYTTSVKVGSFIYEYTL